jgi:catechol 2,3-dioxygenase-like lactoylglutathione lyase family enzyme
MIRDPDGNMIELRPPSSIDDGRRIHIPSATDPADAVSITPARRSPIVGVHHVGVCTLDADRQAAFYLDAGLADLDDSTWTVPSDDGSRDVRRRIRTLSFGNVFLELIEPLDESVAARPAGARIIEYGFNHLCADVDDIASTHPHLMAAGMTVHAPWTPMPGGHAAMGYGLDPTGLPIELLEHRTARSTMWPGHLSLSTPS